MRAKSLQSCPTLCDPMDPPGSSVYVLISIFTLKSSSLRTELYRSKWRPLNSFLSLLLGTHSSVLGVHHSHMCFCIFFFLITNICAYKHFIGLFGMLVNWRNGICSIYHCVACFSHSALWFWNVATLIHVVLNHIFSLLIRVPLNAFTTFYSSPCVRHSANFHIFLLLETRLRLIFFLKPIPLCESSRLGR